jgi:hypothetical protein
MGTSTATRVTAGFVEEFADDCGTAITLAEGFDLT